MTAIKVLILALAFLVDSGSHSKMPSMTRGRSAFRSLTSNFLTIRETNFRTDVKTSELCPLTSSRTTLAME